MLTDLRTKWLLPLLLALSLQPVSLALAQDIKLPDQLQPCECLECLKKLKLEAKAERQAYVDALPRAMKEIQKEMDHFNSHPEYAKDRILFCQMWSIYEDEIDLVRTVEIPKIQKDIFGDDRKCGTLGGGSTNPATCEIDEDLAKLNKVSAPCEQIHLAILAHELVHAEDCEWNQSKPDWLNNGGKSCKEAFAGKTPPTPEQFFEFVKFNYKTEEHAHRIESQVESLLANELTKQCKPGDYSTQMAKNMPEASKFLKRARELQFKPEETATP